MPSYRSPKIKGFMFDPDIGIIGLLLFLVLAALLFPGGPGTPRRVPVRH